MSADALPIERAGLDERVDVWHLVLDDARVVSGEMAVE